ncbi:MAG: hypothetical protein K6T92_02660 [Candidatus Rokubacteria bacterium]|nr:hypothetical protein [Candidatus Rokubacteria bacterium]
MGGLPLTGLARDDDMREALGGLSVGAVRMAEGLLYRIPELRRQIRERRRDIIEANLGLPVTEVKVQRSRVDDMAQQRAIRLATDRKLAEMVAQVRTVDAVLSQVPPVVRKVVAMRFWMGLTWAEIAERVPAGYNTVQRWTRHVVQLVAFAMGWR